MIKNSIKPKYFFALIFVFTAAPSLFIKQNRQSMNSNIENFICMRIINNDAREITIARFLSECWLFPLFIVSAPAKITGTENPAKCNIKPSYKYFAVNNSIQKKIFSKKNVVSAITIIFLTTKSPFIVDRCPTIQKGHMVHNNTNHLNGQHQYDELRNVPPRFQNLQLCTFVQYHTYIQCPIRSKPARRLR